MAASTTTSAVYIHVIEDVINKVREEFVNNGGPGDSVLTELQAMWEMKMMQAGVICGPIERGSGQKPPPPPPPPITPVHDLNVPYDGSEEYETPTAEILFPPTPIQTPLPGSADNSMYNIPTGNSEYQTPVSETSSNTEVKGGRPSPYTQSPSPWTNQRPLSVDVNVAYVEGRDEADRGTSHQPNQPHQPHQPLTQDFFMMSSGKRKREEFSNKYNNGGYIPQQDGAGDSMPETLEVSHEEASVLGHGRLTTANRSVGRGSLKIPQVDGPIPDPYDDVLSTPNIYNYQGVVSEDYNVVNTPAPNDIQAGTPAVVAQNDAVDDDDEELLNEDDDDELDDVDQGDELNTQHLVLAQFDKVTRTKSRWKCTLKDGIMHINNKDILFNKATGEFDF
ncbi:transcription initiation factor IIA large subunit-like isoform X2 [Carica papaya]|uniref:transcription initiation factor IIA large subunit-like isoform X2 n=1 Tax=Carica papaya TaxID=3649 RepID=UPI000B8CD786|nr:transcription initiation factor IIA large subunit-like isoform X2 [Carica papaya]